MITIAVDGPAGAGKSTAAKAVAKRLGLLYLETGAMYRSIGYQAMKLGIPCDDEERVTAMLKNTELSVEYVDGEQRLFVDGEDVTGNIRTAQCGMAASAVSALPEVREMLVEMQRRIAGEKDVIMDGRDIGTVVLPNADLKIYLTAALAARAQRRYIELIDKGVDTTLDDVTRDMELRDKNDSSRDTAPLRKADDAVLLDTTDMDLEESYREIRKIVKDRLGV